MTITPEAILDEVDWVHRLARKLVRDPHLAADLAQETCLTAIDRPPSRGPASLRGWLATVLRNVHLQDRRRLVRRRAHEAGVEPAGVEPSASRTVARLQAHRDVVEEVLALDEPYRSTIVARYFEDRTPTEIARRDKIPLATVATRLRRALAQLRARLDRRHGDRRAWCALLAPWSLAPAAPTGAPIATTTGLLLMKTKTTLLSAGVLALGLVVAWPFLDGAPRGPDARDGVPPASSVDAGAATTPQDAAADRTLVHRAEPAAVAPRGAAEGDVFHGRVFTADGRPAPGIAIGLTQGAGEAAGEPGEPAASDAAGIFTLPVPSGRRQIHGRDPGLATVLAGMVEPSIVQQRVEPAVVVARSCDYAGVVVDAAGRPLAGARVAHALPADFRSRFDAVLDYSIDIAPAARGDAGGRFALAGVGRVPGAHLVATLDGYLPARLAQPVASDADLRFVLERPEPGDGKLAGIVLDPAGMPAADARVSLGRAETASGPDGRFVLDLEVAGPARQLRAMRRGNLPGHRELASEPADRPAFLTLQLGPRPLSMSGQLVDPSGEPVAGVKVFAAEPIMFGRVERSAVSVEGYLAGGMTYGELRARFIENGEPTRPIAEILRDTPLAAWGWVRTDEAGRFTLGGLLDRDYRLSVLWPGSLARFECGPFRAGSRDLRIVAPRPAVHPRVAGQVVDRNGEGIAGVSVVATCDAMRLAQEGGGANTTHASGTRTTTGSDGRFELEDVAADRSYLRLDGERILPVEYGRGVDGGITAVANEPPDALRIVVPIRVHARIELLDPSEADAIAFLDANGQRTPINVYQGGGRRTTETTPFVDGRTDNLTLTDSVTTAVLLAGGEKVREAAIELRGDELQVIRL